MARRGWTAAGSVARCAAAAIAVGGMTAAGAGVAEASTAVRPPACAATQVRQTMAFLAAGMGHTGYRITFTNTSRGTCTLTGYPGVAGLDSHGRQVLQAARTHDGYFFAAELARRGHLGEEISGAPVRTVTLSPGGSAWTVLEWVSNPQQGIPVHTLTSVLLTTPNARTSSRLPFTTPRRSWPVAGAFVIHPVVAGPGAR